MSSDGAYYRVTLEGIGISSDVAALAVQDHDSLTDKATIVLDDPTETTSEVPREGQTVLVDLGWNDAHAVLFEGVIYAVRVDARGTARQRVAISALDLSYRLKRRPAQPVNHVGTLSSILNDLITADPAVGIRVGQIEPDPDPEFSADAPLRQTRQSDWDFIQSLGRRYGCRAFVEYNDEASRFYFIPVARLMEGDPIGTLSYQGSTGRITEIRYERVASAAAPVLTAAVSDPLSGSVVTAAATPPAPEPASAPGDSVHARAPGGGTRLERALQQTMQAVGRPEDQRPQRAVAGLSSDPALAQAAVLQDPTNTLGLRAIGECVGNVNLRAKGRVRLEGVAAWATGEWYVRQANHLFGPVRPGSGHTAYRTRFLLTR